MQERFRYPLSHCQEPFWFHEIAGGGRANIAHVAFTARALDTARLADAFTAVVRRHEALHTAIVSMPGGASGFVAEGCAAKPEFREASPCTDDEPFVRDRLLRELAGPFDLAVAPLCRGLAYRLAGGRHLVGFAFHHLIFDGWSASVFLEDLARTYAGGEPRAAAEPYSAFARAHRDKLGRDRLRELEAFWKSELDGVGEPAEFAMHPDRPDSSTEGKLLEWSAEDVALVAKLSRGLRLTPFAVLLCATGALLHRHSGREDVVIGSPVALRSDARFAGSIGCFVGTLPLRLRVSGSLRFSELAATARARTWRALAHADAPFTEIVRWSNAPRRPDRNPLFGVFLNFLNFPQPRLAAPEFELSAEMLPMPAPRFPLTLYVAWKNAHRLQAVFDAAKLDASYVGALLEQLRAIVRAAAEEPSIRIGDICLAPERVAGARRRLSAPRPAPSFTPVPAVIMSYAERFPEVVAIEKDGAAFTYGELRARALEIAWTLKARGAGALEPVAVVGERSFDLVASALAVWLARCVLVLLDRELPPLRMEAMCEEAGVRRILSTIGAELPANVAVSREIIAVDRDEARARGRETADAAAGVQAPEPAYIFFTSGTTGVPKAVLGTHDGLSHFLEWQRERFNVTAWDRVAAITGLSFDVVLRELFLPLTSGATLVLPPGRTAALPDAAWLRRSGATLLHVVPTVARAMLPALAAAGGLPALRWTFFAGEPLHQGVARSWRDQVSPNGALANLYGPTETTLAKCAYVLADPPIEGIQPVGEGIPGADVFVANAGLEPCAPGEPGEIVIRTPYRTRGYLDDPACGGRFVRNPDAADPDDFVYLTGDAGRARPGGTVEILGRRDAQLKISGVRVEPEEVASVIRRHRSVRDAAVVGYARDTRQSLAAYIQPVPGARLELEDLVAFLRVRLLQAMVPQDFVVVDRLPRTLNGKLDRRALEVLRPVTLRQCVAPRNELEKAIAGLWQARLGSRPFGVLDAFFDVGGTSLNLIELLPELSKLLGRELTVAELVQNLTIASLARLRTDTPAGDPGLDGLALRRSDMRRSSRSALRARAERARSAQG